MAQPKQGERNGIGRRIVTNLSGDLVFDLLPFPIFLLAIGIFFVWVVLKRALYIAAGPIVRGVDAAPCVQ